jgi:hypothetical protein
MKPYLWVSPVADQRLPRGVTASKLTRQLPLRVLGEGALGKGEFHDQADNVKK